ncbi:MAG: tRNA (N6-isopentenyl adenosine(37)-C2)-methylthiotransferase MiaB [Nitrospirota bacterium]
MLHFFMERTVYIKTFGCQMNVHDSEKILGIMEKQGYTATDNVGNADIVIFNTCSIRQKAEQKFYSELGRIKSLKKKRPGTRIIVAGCIAQQEGEKIFKHAPHVDMVFGPENIHALGTMAAQKTPIVAVHGNPAIALHDLPVKRGDGARAWVTIMYGCNNYCSYCIVPFTRGRERSRPSANIRAEVEELARMEYKEVTLLGQNVNSYRSDIGFSALLEMLDAIQGIERIRFVTSHPRDLSDELISAISSLHSVCEHIHLPIQSGSSRILHRMNRGYSYDQYLEGIEKLRRKVPGIAITTDIIAGFPGETEGDHKATMSALREIEFDGIFAFKYSERPWTKAAEMDDQVAEGIKANRLNEILLIQDKITSGKNKLLEGTIQEILIEGRSETDRNKMSGRTRTNKIVNVAGNGYTKGSMVSVRIIRGRKHSLEGKPL